MATQYTPILKLALPVTGELSGTWGDVVNDNITSMIEQAVAGLATINTWTANSNTLTTANGTTATSRCAILVAATGTGGTALTAAGTIICPASSKLYVLRNTTVYAVTLKTPSGTGIIVPPGRTMSLFCDGTNVNITDLDGIPISGAAKTTSYSLQKIDVGQTVQVNTGGSITIPNSTFAAGDAVLVVNNTTGGITITCTITTAYIAGTDEDKATVTLATRGVANILFLSGTVCIITGNVT
jgi:hypothetical protein